jgi:hypothetical protein
MSDENQELSNIELSSYIKSNNERKFKSNIGVFVVLLLIFGVLFLISHYGENFLIFSIFIIIFIIPVFILFKTQILNMLPDYVKNSLTTIEESESRDTIDFKFRISQYIKEILCYIAAVIFCIGSIYLLYIIHKLLNKGVVEWKPKTIELQGDSIKKSKEIIIKCIGSFICICISGVIILEIS